MKIYQFLIFTTLVIYIHNICIAGDVIENYKNCTSRVLNIVEKALGSVHCCYFNGVSGNQEIKSCIPITQSEYDNMDETIKFYEKIFEVKVKSFIC